MPSSHGAKIYANKCAKCHGNKGQGVANEYDEPLTGDWPLEKLVRVITKTMPEEDPSLCIDKEAELVANYIFKEFYSPKSRALNNRPRIKLSRLTNRQFLHSVADLIGNFTGNSFFNQSGGLKANYFNNRNLSQNKQTLNKINESINFDYGATTPYPNNVNFKQEEFSMRWSGSVFAEETGDHKFIISSENGVRLWVNNMDLKLIEGWVSSGQRRELTGTVRLIGGRAYPIKLDYFKYKSKSASVKLEWHPPHGSRQVLPPRNLSPNITNKTFVFSQPFPPDDSSIGYKRGNSISKKWDESATYAAIETANWIAENLDSLAKTTSKSPDRLIKAKQLASRFAEYAFRRPLTTEEDQIFVHSRFGPSKPETDSIKEVILLTLKSPRFLYPDLGQMDDYSIAARLALGLWDSLPDTELAQAAAAGRLKNENQVRQQAMRMLHDPRTKAKLRSMMHHWLGLDYAEEIAKDRKIFPQYDKSLEADLRTSLNLFLDEIIWENAGADFRALFNSNQLPLNSRLAKVYRVQHDGTKSEFSQSSFDTNKRAGVLTHPYLLTLYSYHNSTSPIHRGVFITRNLLGRSLKPPPEAVAFKDEGFEPNMTMREKVTQTTKADSCMTCHSIINPIGFSLENFDSIGRFRQTDNGRPIDTSSEYLTVEGNPIHINDPPTLASHAINSPSAHKRFIEMLFNQVAKQPIQAYGSGALRQLYEDFASANYNIRYLLVEIAVISAMKGLGQKEI
ncbi:MAG: DUF1592 domain-containing protein [Verrucomicrobiota bacterium]|nr:DUF1592 domain-containing protein [Verrucomicrobiota bacterium]